MCGIAGYIASEKGNTEHKEQVFKVATALMLAAQERGTHATGYVASHRAGEWSLDGKAEGPATKFVKTQDWLNVRRHLPHMVVGHTRHTTRTTASVMGNNHPFFGHRQPWALVHNGWLINDDEERASLVKGGIKFDSETDSEVILRLAEETDNPVDGAVNTLATLRGPQAVALLNYPEDSPAHVYLWTNGGNPLCIARLTQIPGVVFFASTERILETAVALALGKKALKGLSAERIKAGRIMRVRSLKKSVKVEECARMEEEDIAHTVTKRRTYYQTTRPFGRHDISGITDYFDRAKHRETGRRGHVIVVPAHEAFTRGATEAAWEEQGAQMTFVDDIPTNTEAKVRKVAEGVSGKSKKNKKTKAKK